MLFFGLLLSLFVNTSYAEVGKVSKVLGAGDAFIVRGQQKVTLSIDANLEEGDEVHSRDSVLVLLIYPATQLSISKQTQVTLTKSLIEGDGEKEKSFSIINFVKGIIRLQVTKDENLQVEQQVVADGVAFAVRGTEFEVSLDGEDYDLDVVEGEVEVSSPYVQTFVPEIVKANEGFRFNKKARKFQRRKFRMKFKDHPGFARKEEVREKWKLKRMEMKARRQDKQGLKRGNRQERQVGRIEKLNGRRERSRR